MVLEYGKDGLCCSVDTAVKRAAQERLINFAQAGIAFEVPKWHQLRTFADILSYLERTASSKCAARERIGPRTEQPDAHAMTG